MSLIQKQPKQKINKTDDLGKYYADYRNENRTHLNNLERLKYYKKRYGIDDDFVEKFGEYSGDVFKIKKEMDRLRGLCPELIQHILTLCDSDSD